MLATSSKVASIPSWLATRTEFQALAFTLMLAPATLCSVSFQTLFEKNSPLESASARLLEGTCNFRLFLYFKIATIFSF